MAFSKINIETTVGTSAEKAWEYWTLPEHITNWNFASDDWQCPSASNDLRAGGKYAARMEAKDGSFGFDFEAVYDEVIPHKRIVYTMGDGRQAITDFEEVGNKTRIRTSFDAEKQNSEEMQKDGWQAILDNYKKYAESKLG